MADGRAQLAGLPLTNLSNLAPTPGSLVVIDSSTSDLATTDVLGNALRLANAGAIVLLLTQDPADVSGLPGERIL